jgi:hypothetical protein
MMSVAKSGQIQIEAECSGLGDDFRSMRPKVARTYACDLALQQMSSPVLTASAASFQGMVSPQGYPASLQTQRVRGAPVRE